MELPHLVESETLKASLISFFYSPSGQNVLTFDDGETRLCPAT